MVELKGGSGNFKGAQSELARGDKSSTNLPGTVLVPEL